MVAPQVVAGDGATHLTGRTIVGTSSWQQVAVATVSSKWQVKYGRWEVALVGGVEAWRVRRWLGTGRGERQCNKLLVGTALFAHDALYWAGLAGALTMGGPSPS